MQFQVKVEVAKSESEVPPHNDSEQADRTRGSRGERRNEKFIPADSEQTYNKTHYNGRGGGRPKPTKGSEIQLNIFSLVQVYSTRNLNTWLEHVTSWS